MKRKPRNPKSTNAGTILMKTGVVTLTATTLTGLTAGMGPMVYAEDAADPMNAEIAMAQTSIPDSVMEAEAAAQEAQAAREAAEAEEAAALAAYVQAQADAAAAQAEMEAAQAQAQEAFQEAQQHAAAANAAAQESLDQATENVEAARDLVSETEASYNDAVAAYQEAESEYTQAAEAYPYTEEDVATVKSDVKTAESNEASAKELVDDYAGAVSEAEEILSSAEETRKGAEANVATADSDMQEAADAVETAQRAADQATADLADIQAFIEGTKDLTTTAEYRTEQEAAWILNETEAEVASKKAEAEAAQAEYGMAQAGTAEKEAALHDATVDYDRKQSEAEAAASTKMQAETAQESARNAASDAQLDAETAGNELEAAEKNQETADQERKDAAAGQAAAEQAVMDAEEALTQATADANAEVDQRLADANAVIIADREAYDATLEMLQNVEANYKLGTLGFIDWMLGKDDLTKLQLQDLTAARNVIISGMSEDITQYGAITSSLPKDRNNMVFTLGDEKESTSIANITKSISIMKQINAYRASDDNFTGALSVNPSGTNFYMLASSEGSAMRGAELFTHSAYNGQCENLAWGYNDATAGWYVKEKRSFDKAKEILGITTITSEAQIYDVMEEAYAQGWETGHYTNLFWSVDQVMGVGYTGYNRTSAYNAFSAASMMSDRYNTGKHVYTIEEFEALFEEYVKTLDASECEAAVKEAKKALDEAEENAQTIEASREEIVNAATSAQQQALTEKQREKQTAEEAAADAAKRAEEAEAELDTARQNKDAADEKLQDASVRLEEATKNADTARQMSEAADAALEEALSVVKGMKQEFDDAVLAEADAKQILEDRQTDLEDAQARFASAQTDYDTAKSALDALTSEETLLSKQQEKEAADQALATAGTVLDEKTQALEDAKESLKAATDKVEAAQAALEEEKEKLADAEAAYEEARNQTDAAREKLEAILDACELVSEAAQKKTNAEEAMQQAKQEAEDAATFYETLKEILDRAENEKDLTADRLSRALALSYEDALTNPIEDEAFAYLNEYMEKLDSAANRKKAADELLEAVKSHMENAQHKAAMARAELIAAMVDLSLAKEAVVEKADPAVYSDRKTVSETSAVSPVVKMNNIPNSQLQVHPQEAPSEDAPDTVADLEQDMETDTPWIMEALEQRSLAYGDVGEEVAQMQAFLIALGFLEDAADGQFGPLTERAVSEFQKIYGIEETGVADPYTVAVLNDMASCFAEEDFADAVEITEFRTISIKKNAEGLYYVAPNTVSDKTLEEAGKELQDKVAAYQDRTELSADEEAALDEALTEARKAYTAIRVAYRNSNEIPED